MKTLTSFEYISKWNREIEILNKIREEKYLEISGIGLKIDELNADIAAEQLKN